MGTYYKSEHLAKFASVGEGSKKLADKFFDYYQSVFEPGALSAKEKSLIALAVAHAVQCPYCIDVYSKDCLQKGADLEQMTEAVHVTTAIRGGASLVHGMQMLEHVHGVAMGGAVEKKP
ncbi:MAG: arsenosugar biosynthesis-associated peroxidase-like protein [Elusimicrobiota bacterium]